jgi:hypothetical protein
MTFKRIDMKTTSHDTPSAWQQAVGRQLAEALARGAGTHPPARDDAAAGDEAPLRSRWLVARRSSGTPSPALQALARHQAPDPAGRAKAGSLLARCLQHYREQIRPDDEDDDAGVALACFLAACVQAQDGLAVTPERWRAVHDWVEAWVADGLDWEGAPADQRGDFFERMACLAVAIGEWSVVASRQGEAAVRSAQLLARTSLQAQLGLSLETLASVVRGLDAAQPRPAAGDPSWGDAELPKAPTSTAAGERL